MRVQVFDSGINLWASARDTYDWATRPGAAWPGSTLSDRRFFASFDRNGLCDLTVDGRDADDIDGHELSCCAADLLRDSGKVPTNHPCYGVAIGQFLVA